MERSIPLAGTWFPADPAQLHDALDQWGRAALDASPLPLPSAPAAILVPHAGYPYSGPTAAAVYARLDAAAYDTILLMAPSHRVHMPQAVSVEPSGTIHTPCGPVHLDDDFCRQLRQLPGATHKQAAHTQEHSLDIQLPLLYHFILRKRPAIRVGGLVCGQWTWDGGAGSRAMARFAVGLRSLLSPRTLVIISTDFTHFGPQFGYVPFTDQVEAGLDALDHAVFAAFAGNDNARFDQIMEETGATVCGRAPMALLLAALPPRMEALELAYTTSGRLTGDWGHSVSYLGAVVLADWSAPLKPETEAMCATTNASSDAETLSPEDARRLLELARRALDYAVRRGMPMPLAEMEAETPLPSRFGDHRGAFVTLHRHGELRGCIGELLPQRPLGLVVAERAHDAALRDRRFAPVSTAELPDIDVEVSVLSEPQAVASCNDIELGRHGVIMQKQGRSAVFLPQVAPEQGWDLPTTLTHLSMKAGLPHDAWRHGADFFVFTAQVIH